MKIKNFRQFFEDVNSNSSSVAGSGDVSNPTVNVIPGVPGEPGSGDLSFYLRTKNKGRKKGKPNEVSDLRDLSPTKEVTHLKEGLDLSHRMPELNQDIKSIVDDCLLELTDEGFELNMLKYDNSSESVEIDEDEYGEFIQEELRISLHKTVNMIWTGNFSLRCNFTDTVEDPKISTLRPSGKELNEEESNLLEITKLASLRLRDFLEYQRGVFNISYLVAGSAMPWNSERPVNVNVDFTLYNDIKI